MYSLKRFRFPAVIALCDETGGEARARFDFMPGRGFPVTFADGECFRLGWTDWVRQKWAWTNDENQTVLLSKHSAGTARISFRLGPAEIGRHKQYMLKLLELARNELSAPLFSSMAGWVVGKEGGW